MILAALPIPPALAGSLSFVKVETNLGPFTLELDADKAPVTVANFLGYLAEGFYKDTLFHRSPKGFVVQGGGFDRTTSFASPTQKATHAPIALESNNGLSNLRGTIAMARTNVADSATSQFFINVVDNKFLDHSSANAGYAVFGRVVDGMAVIDAINALPVAKNIIKGVSAVFQDMPILDSQSTPPVPVYISNISLLLPIADAGQHSAVASGAAVTLDGSASRNQNPADSSPLAYQWTQTAGPTVDLSGVANQARPLFTAPTVAADTVLGFQLVVTNAGGQASPPATVNITVKAPVAQPKDPNRLDCSGAAPSRDALWPANGGWVAVAIGGIEGPARFALRIDKVTSDEPVKDKAAKDTTGPDAKIRRGKATRAKPLAVDGVLLRAERQVKRKNGAGSGNGRVYAVGFTASSSDQTCGGSVKVAVPPAMGVTAVDDGQKFEATANR